MVGLSYGYATSKTQTQTLTEMESPSKWRPRNSQYFHYFVANVWDLLRFLAAFRALCRLSFGQLFNSHWWKLDCAAGPLHLPLHHLAHLFHLPHHATTENEQHRRRTLLFFHTLLCATWRYFGFLGFLRASINNVNGGSTQSIGVMTWREFIQVFLLNYVEEDV